MNLVSHLLKTNESIQQVIVASSADQSIYDMVKERQIPVQTYGPQIQAKLVEEGRRYQWLLNLWSPHLLRPSLLALADNRLNVHPGLLPHCRGNDCAAWAIRKGLPAGVTLLEMREGIDVGEIYVQREVACPFPMRGQELHELLQRESEKLFEDHWPEIRSGAITPKPQSGLVSSHTRRQTNQDRVLDSSVNMSVDEFMSWVLAHDFSPGGTTAEVRYGGQTYRLSLAVETNIRE